MNTALYDLLQFGFQNALVATVLALGVCLLTRYWRNPLLGRTLWLLVLIKLVTPPLWQMPLALPTAPTTAATTDAPTRTFQSPDSGWPGLTNAQARSGDRRAIRFATDPATLARIGSETTSMQATPSHQAGPTSGWIDEGLSRGPAAALITASASRLHRPQPQATAAHPSTDSRLTATFTTLAGRLPDVSLWSLAGGVWLSGSLVMLLLIGGRTWRFARHLRRCPPASAADHEAVAAIARQVGLSRAPEVRSSTATHPPLVWCLGWRPVLVLPRSLMQQLNDDEQTTVLAHELAHIRRGDHLVRLLEAAVITLFWWHPVVWWARRELQRCEEQCCDADVLRICPDSPETYVGVLVKTVEYLQTRRPVAVAFTSAMAQRHSLVERVERILGDDGPAHWSWASRLTTLALVALLPLSVGWGAAAPQEEPTNPAQQTSNATGETAEPTDEPADEPTGERNEEPTEEPGTEPIDPPAASAAAAETNAEPPAERTSTRSTGREYDPASVSFQFTGPEGLHVYRGRDRVEPGQNSADDGFKEDPDEEPLTAPCQIDLVPGAVYRLKLSDIPGHAGLTLFPTLEVPRPNPMWRRRSLSYHSRSVPIRVTDEDLQQVVAGNFVTKVLYLPDEPDEQGEDQPPVGIEVLVSTRLDPDLDPVVEAKRRGTIAAVLRLGDRAKPPVAKPQQELVPFDRPYGEVGFSDGDYGPHYETVRLATHAPVQDELDLSASQRRRLVPVHISLMQKSNQWPRGSVDQPNFLKEEYARTLSILTAAQKQRLDEIIFRRLGYMAFLKPQFAEQIGLAPQQSEQFRQAWQKHAERGEDGWKGDEGRQAYHKLQAEVFAALTPEQRQRYAELIGPGLQSEAAEKGVFFVFIEQVLHGHEHGGKLYPVPVREDGTILLPLISPISVEGLRAGQVQKKVRAAYLKAGIISPDHEVAVSTVQLQQTPQEQQQQEQQQAAVSRLMPEFVNEVLYWLPTDTETLIVSRDFQARSIHDDANLQKSLAEPHAFSTLTRSLATVPLFDLPLEVQALLTDKQIEWAVLGGRNYEFTSAFGGYRFDGCTVLKFAEPTFRRGLIGSAETAVMPAIMETAQDRWTISGKSVYVFPVNEKERESWVKPRTGEGLYVVIHDDRTMILATSDVYLLQTLRRIEGASLDPVVPFRLLESHDIKFDAGTWGIRRVPENSKIAQPTTVSSVTWTSVPTDQPDEMFVVQYRPRGNADLLEPLRQDWLRSEKRVDPRIIEVRRSSDGFWVVFQQTTNAGYLLPALLFPIQGLPATSF